MPKDTDKDDQNVLWNQASSWESGLNFYQQHLRVVFHDLVVYLASQPSFFPMFKKNFIVWGILNQVCLTPLKKYLIQVPPSPKYLTDVFRQSTQVQQPDILAT